jgi:hypothetical protein
MMEGAMTEEYYEKHDMERDLGSDVEPYTEEELEKLYRLVEMAAYGDPGEGNE